MKDGTKPPIEIDPNGFNELKMCRSGPMIYNKHDVYIGGSLQKYGEFSFAEQQIFSRIVRPGGLVVEVGANVGAHTVELSRLAGPDGEVHAFEPQRIVFQTLCANLALNNCANVFARQAAVGEIPAPFSYRRSILRSETISVDSRCMRQIWRERPFGHDRRPRSAGMSVAQGRRRRYGSRGAPRGATQLIETYRPLMYLENDRIERSEELLAIVERFHYNAYWHFPRMFNPPIISATWKIFLGRLCPLTSSVSLKKRSLP